MKGKITVITIASVVIYLLLVFTLYFASVFMVSWGEESHWYINFIAFLQNTPFGLIREDGEMKMSLIFVNALFWTLCIAGLLFLAALFVRKKSS